VTNNFDFSVRLVKPPDIELEQGCFYRESYFKIMSKGLKAFNRCKGDFTQHVDKGLPIQRDRSPKEPSIKKGGSSLGDSAYYGSSMRSNISQLNSSMPSLKPKRVSSIPSYASFLTKRPEASVLEEQ
jgi:hypothetical protein